MSPMALYVIYVYLTNCYRCHKTILQTDGFYFFCKILAHKSQMLNIIKYIFPRLPYLLVDHYLHIGIEKDTFLFYIEKYVIVIECDAICLAEFQSICCCVFLIFYLITQRLNVECFVIS